MIYLASSVIKKNSYKKDESEPYDRHSMKKLPSKEPNAGVNNQENSNLYNKNNIINNDKIRTSSHYEKRPTKQLIQVFGEFNIEEFSKIGNQFSNETQSNKVYKRTEIIQSQPNELMRNPTNNFQNYPTINSILENNLDESRISFNHDDNSNLNNNPDYINNNFNNKDKFNCFKTNNTTNKNTNNFDFGLNFQQQNKNDSYHPTIKENKVNNITWDFTKNNANNIDSNNKNYNVTNGQLNNFENRIAPTYQVMNSPENNVDLNSNEINFDELLSTKKTKISQNNLNNHNLNAKTNNSINSKDPFEGFY